jgi:Glycosyltransferase
LNFLIEKNEAKKFKYLKRLQKNIDRADYITTISDYTKKAIEDHMDLQGKSIRTIYNGIRINPRGSGHKPGFVDNKKFFFSIGIFNGKKNFHVLLPVMKHFMDYKLIIAGDKDTSYGKQVQQQINDMGLTGRVILPGKIDDSEKTWLYEHCDAFLFPSLAEGFGMPVIEAMKFGKPVFLSKYTSLPEIGGDSAFFFENFDEEYMSSFIKSRLSYYNENQDTLSGQIREHADSFSWESCITQYLKLYNEIAIKG